MAEKFADAGQVHSFTGVCPTVALHVLWDLPAGTDIKEVQKLSKQLGVRPGSINPNDIRWLKDDFHASLKADDGQGCFVSLSHGWANGPTAWLMDNILGVLPEEPGFRRVLIRPDLLDLESASGTVFVARNEMLMWRQPPPAFPT